MKLKIGLLAVLFVVFLLACSKDEKNPVNNLPALEPKLSSIQANIFDLSCALSGCHAGSSPQENLNLEAGQAYINLVNVPSRQNPNLMRVDPNRSDQSYLIHKLEGQNIGATARMPLNRSPLSAEQINAIKQWIDAGAPNN